MLNFLFLVPADIGIMYYNDNIYIYIYIYIYNIL